MKRKKLLILLILCFIIGSDVCEGSTAPPQFRKDNSYFTTSPSSAGDHLERFELRGTQTASTRVALKLTPLPLVENVDPSDSVYGSGHQAESIQDEDIAEEAANERSSETDEEREPHDDLTLTIQTGSEPDHRSGHQEESIQDGGIAEEAAKKRFSKTKMGPEPHGNLGFTRRAGSDSVYTSSARQAESSQADNIAEEAAKKIFLETRKEPEPHDNLRFTRQATSDSVYGSAFQEEYNQDDYISEKVGKKRSAETRKEPESHDNFRLTRQAGSSSRHVTRDSTAIPQKETNSLPNSSHETDCVSGISFAEDDNDKGGTRDGSARSGEDEYWSQGIPKLTADEGSSRHATRAIPHESTRKLPDSAYGTDRITETVAKDGKDKNGTSKGYSRSTPDEPWSRGKPKMSSHERSSRRATSTSQDPDMDVRPEMKSASAGFRWNAHHDQGRLNDRKKWKKKKKKTSSETTENKFHSGTPEEPASEESASPNTVAAVVSGLLAGAMVLLVVVTVLWRKCKNRLLRRDDPELGLATPWMTGIGEELSDEEIIFERKAAGMKKTSTGTPQSTAGTTGTSLPEEATGYSTHAPATWTLTDTPRSTPFMAPCTDTDTERTSVWLVNETSELRHLLSSSDTSVISELSWTPKETPPSPSPKSLPTISSASESEIWTCVKKTLSQPETPTATTSEEKWALTDNTESANVESQYKISSSTLPEGCSSSTTTESASFPNVPKEFTRTASMQTGASNSSTESCKTPVAPLTEVVITIDDEEDSKWVLVSESECSSGEVIYPLGNVSVAAKSEVCKHEAYEECMPATQNDDGCKSSMDSNEASSGKTPLPPPQVKPPSATTELRKGKSLIGGRKALGNRRYIKHLTSGQRSSGFQGDLKKAVSKILLDSERFAGKNKQKRKVVKEQTKGTRTSMREGILLAKSIIMDEKLDSVRDKKSALRRRIIRKALCPSAGSALGPHSSLSKEIAFAQSVILRNTINQITQRRTQERSKVIKERVKELKNPSFEDRVKIAASTINPDETTRDLNGKNSHRRSVIKMDAQMLKAQNKTSKFVLDIKFCRNVICGHSTLDHEKHPQMGCLCYYCKKHWRKTGGPPCFKLPRAIAIAKDIILIDGKLYFLRPKNSPTARDRSGPNTPLACDPAVGPCASEAT